MDVESHFVVNCKKGWSHGTLILVMHEITDKNMKIFLLYISILSCNCNCNSQQKCLPSIFFVCLPFGCAWVTFPLETLYISCKGCLKVKLVKSFPKWSNIIVQTLQIGSKTFHLSIRTKSFLTSGWPKVEQKCTTSTSGDAEKWMKSMLAIL